MEIVADASMVAGTATTLELDPANIECTACFPDFYALQVCDTVTWHFGDGTPDVTTTGKTWGTKIAHTYAAPGAYLPSVTMSNTLGTRVVRRPWPPIIVTSDPPTYVDFSPTTITVPETAGSITFTLVRSGNLTTTAKVHYSHGPAPAGFIPQAEVLSGDVTFAAGETTKTFTMKIFDDHMYTGPAPVGDEVFATATDGTLIPKFKALYLLTEVDPQPTATASDVRVVEGTATQNTADIVVSMSAPINALVEFLGTASNGTAKLGSDFSGQQPFCNLLPGETQCVLHIPLINDDVPEPDETFTFKFWNYGWAVPNILGDTVSITIVNDDAVFTPASTQITTGARVSLKLDIGQAPAAPLTIPLQSSSPEVLEVPASVTFGAGESIARVSAHALQAGRSRVTASVPGTNTPSSLITVVDAVTIIADPSTITLRAGSDANVSLSLQPPRAAALRMRTRQSCGASIPGATAATRSSFILPITN